MDNIVINDRLRALRRRMREEKKDVLYMETGDPHRQETVAERFELIRYFTGCSSDNAVLILTQDEGILWTDSRYAISAKHELSGSGISLVVYGTGGEGPDDALSRMLGRGSVLAADGMLTGAVKGEHLKRVAESSGAIFCTDFDPWNDLWIERPFLPCRKVTMLGPDKTGRDTADKLAEVRRTAEANGASAVLVASLPESMWLLNMRGDDVDCCSCAYMYALVEKNGVVIFADEGHFDDESRGILEGYGASFRPYGDIKAFLSGYGEKVLADPAVLPYGLASLMEERGILFRGDTGIGLMKAMKNETEKALLKECVRRDSAAVCRFLYWLEKHRGEGITEFDAAKKLDEIRRGTEGFIRLSFPTISAFGPSGALPHYAVTEESAKRIEDGSFYLFDSGGTYEDGTTDITRTVPVGEVTDRMKRDYTLVLKGVLALYDLKFPEGTSGGNIDAFARRALWEYGLDYGHGTGHGVGFRLCVHEGPHSISPRGQRAMVPLREGMISSAEPGLYIEGEYGIRLENLVCVTEREKTPFGNFLGLTTLTFVPFDKRAIDRSLLSSFDIEKLNDYHKAVALEISGYLGDDEREWLYEATSPI